MSAPVPLRDRRRAEIRRELAAAAIRLFAEHGAANTTVDAIVAAAGCSPSTFFRHFPTKEDTVFFDAPEVLERLRVALAQADGESVWTIAARHLVRAGVEFVDASEELALVRLRLFHHDPAIAARYGQVCAEREQVIAEFLLSRLGDGPEVQLEAWVQAGAIIAAARAALRTVAEHGGNLAEQLDRAITRMQHGFASTSGSPGRRAPIRGVDNGSDPTR